MYDIAYKAFEIITSRARPFVSRRVGAFVLVYWRNSPDGIRIKWAELMRRPGIFALLHRYTHAVLVNRGGL